MYENIDMTLPEDTPALGIVPIYVTMGDINRSLYIPSCSHALGVLNDIPCTGYIYMTDLLSEDIIFYGQNYPGNVYMTVELPIEERERVCSY